MEDMTNNTEATETVEAQEEARTYTAEEVQALLQSEADKRVTAALKKQQAKYEKQLSLSKLDDEARAKAEKDARIEELEAQLQQYAVEKARSELKSVLSARGLSAEFADIISITDDTEENQATIDAFDKLFKANVKAEVERRLAASGGAPKGNGSSISGEITQEMVRKMSIAELQELKNTKPEIYKKFYN